MNFKGTDIDRRRKRIAQSTIHDNHGHVHVDSAEEKGSSSQVPLISESRSELKNKKKNKDKKSTRELDVIRRAIREEHDFVRRLVNTVPPSVYFDAETLERYNAQKHARGDEKLEIAGVKRYKNLSKSAKLQRSKLDPDQQRSVIEIQDELANLSDSNDKEEEDVDDDEIMRRPTTSDRSNSIEELRQRLQMKLASFRGGTTSGILSEAQEKKRLLRRMRKLKSKEKRQGKNKDVALKTLPELKPNKKQKLPKEMPAKPVFNKEGKMVFSKFDFTDSSSTAAEKCSTSTKRERQRSQYAGKDYRKLLGRVERDKQKLEEVRQRDAAKAQELQEKSAWRVALDRAEGIKIKTDLDLLKKALKRKEYRKKKTDRQWTERVDSVKRRQELKQKKRHENIQSRKKDKIKNKMKKAVKRGRLVPGFS